MSGPDERPTPARCPTCEAPALPTHADRRTGAKGVPLELGHVYDVAWRFSLRAALEARVRALTDKRCEQIWGAGADFDTWGGDFVHAKEFRAALLEALAPKEDK